MQETLPPFSDSHDPAVPVWPVRLQPSGMVFGAPATQTVLMAALQAGIELPSACRNGTCRECLCRITRGQIQYLMEWPGVSREEQSEGWFLPCVAQARTALEIEHPLAQAGFNIATP